MLGPNILRVVDQQCYSVCMVLYVPFLVKRIKFLFDSNLFFYLLSVIKFLQEVSKGKVLISYVRRENMIFDI